MTQIFNILHNDKSKIRIQKTCIFFTIFISSLLSLPILDFFINFVDMPFNAIHELGHFLLLLLLYPNSHPQITIIILENIWEVNHDPLYMFDYRMIFIFVGGVGAVLVTVLTLVFILRKKTSPVTNCVKNWLIFGIVIDFPDILPLIPKYTHGIESDGFHTYQWLVSNLKFPPITEFFINFLLVRIIITILAYIFLSLAIYWGYKAIHNKFVYETK